MSSAEKIALFRELFRGRLDVFPRRWVNQRKGTHGYSPACSNEWIRGVCDKPRVKCGECPNQAFLPVTDRVIVDHLQGRHVVGVYPLLPDETCWFLAVDFDKGTWREDVAAFVETCDRMSVPAAVERSRSGNGAHVWFFFSEAIPASTARKMGSYLITETMARHHELPMSSYDRFFPNQDTLPRGGFGNLIALPLQKGPRQQGNTVFVGLDWVPHADQWAHLASHPRIEPTRAESLANEAKARGKVVGIRLPEWTDEEAERRPWKHSPSRGSERLAITQPLPDRVQAVLAQPDPKQDALLWQETTGNAGVSRAEGHERPHRGRPCTAAFQAAEWPARRQEADRRAWASESESRRVHWERGRLARRGAPAERS